jgi:hypothetical protein
VSRRLNESQGCYNASEKTKTSCLCRASNHDALVSYPGSLSLFRLNYPGFLWKNKAYQNKNDVFEYKNLLFQEQNVRNLKIQATPIINFIITKKFLVEFESVVIDEGLFIVS